MWRFTYNHVYCYVNLVTHTSHWVYGHRGVGVYIVILCVYLWSQVRPMAVITSQLIVGFPKWCCIYYSSYIYCIYIIYLKYDVQVGEC